jgi:hypothetical protein
MVSIAGGIYLQIIGVIVVVLSSQAYSGCTPEQTIRNIDSTLHGKVGVLRQYDSSETSNIDRRLIPVRDQTGRITKRPLGDCW